MIVRRSRISKRGLIPSLLRELSQSLVPSETTKPVWSPFPGKPQEDAYYSEADELFYGGAAGAGKTDLALGTAFTAHRRSIIFRREYPQLAGIIERGDEIATGAWGERYRFNGNKKRWRTRDGRLIELGALQYENDKQKYKGRPHDLYVFDEITDFTRSQYKFVTGWNRTEIPGQRTRIICTGNPPTDAEGEWVIQHWAAWLDEKHPNPAKPGELRWYAQLDGVEVERPNGEPFEHHNEALGITETIYPRSRTFIPGRVFDNPVYMATGYVQVLQGLDEPFRSQFLYGKFNTQIVDDPYQVIPTAWVLAAQARWVAQRPDVALRALGVDVAHGGSDKTVIARLYGSYFDELVIYPGQLTPDGKTTRDYVLAALGDDKAPIFIDAIGYGASAYERLRDEPGVETYAVNFGDGSEAKDRSGKFKFANKRAEAYWKLREALNPNSGEEIALPPLRSLRLDLTTPRYSITGGKIAIEAKKEIKKRIGRSPDYGDAVVIAWYGARKSGGFILFGT